MDCRLQHECIILKVQYLSTTPLSLLDAREVRFYTQVKFILKANEVCISNQLNNITSCYFRLYEQPPEEVCYLHISRLCRDTNMAGQDYPHPLLSPEAVNIPWIPPQVPSFPTSAPLMLIRSYLTVSLALLAMTLYSHHSVGYNMIIRTITRAFLHCLSIVEVVLNINTVSQLFYTTIKDYRSYIRNYIPVYVAVNTLPLKGAN